MSKKHPYGSSAKEEARINRVRGTPFPEDSPPLNHEMARIRDWLKKVRFKKYLFGGVREADVWKKFGELNTMYEAAISAERARYDALLADQRAKYENALADQRAGPTARSGTTSVEGILPQTEENGEPQKRDSQNGESQ